LKPGAALIKDLGVMP